MGGYVECFPPCKVCTGLCQKVPAKPPPQRATAKRAGRTKRERPEAREGYIVLVCGHYTTLGEQRATPGFHRNQRKHWCDKCQDRIVAYTMSQRIDRLKKETPLF